MWKIFYFKDRIIFKDNLLWFEKVLLDSKYNDYCIYFDFYDIKLSLIKLKYIILKNINFIDFNNLYFYNSNDFINLLLDKPIYLPNNINLFINEKCFIWCNYCDNNNDCFEKLSLWDIKIFLWKYNLWDNINYNIIWQWDPLFHSDLFNILEYIKSIWWHITFFTWWKSLLYCKDINKLNSFVDEFKINLSSSSYQIYNKTHSNKINKVEFDKLINKIKIIAKKSTFITILTSKNISDLYKFYMLAVNLNCYWLEIKKNLFYNKNDILNNLTIKNNIIKLLKIFSKNKYINFSSNINWNFIQYNNISNFIDRSSLLLDRYINNNFDDIDIDDINKLDKCFQFGNSIDIIEKWVVSVCCHYDIWNISQIDYDGLYYNNILFKEKYLNYKIKTPKSCEKCPMPIDRYKNYLKYNFVSSLV